MTASRPLPFSILLHFLPFCIGHFLDCELLFNLIVWIVVDMILFVFLNISDLLFCFLQAFVLQQKGNLMELVDPKLGTEFKKDEAIRMIKVALLCTNPSPALRPTMSAVVSMLKGQTVIQEYPLNPSIYGDEFGFEALRGQYDQMQLQSSSDIEPLNHSSHTAQSGSSLTSSQDP